MSLIEAKDALRPLLSAGARCPCCTQEAKIYSRKLYRNILDCLVKAYAAGAADTPVHIPTLLGGHTSARNFGLMQYWDLVQEVEAEPADGKKKTKRSGKWTITDLGIQWMRGETTIWSHVLVYDNRRLGIAEGAKQITFKECMEEEFDIDEVLGVAPDAMEVCDAS